MKALSLHQPWASLVIAGAKLYETRSRRTHYRGLLAIHATSRDPVSTPQLAYLTHVLLGRNLDELPRGALLGTVEVTDCQSATDLRPTLSATEFALGGWEDGRFGWRLINPTPLAQPFPLAGHRGFWPVPQQALDALYANGHTRPN